MSRSTENVFADRTGAGIIPRPEWATSRSHERERVDRVRGPLAHARGYICLLVLLAAVLGCATALAGGFVEADGTGLTLDGKPYRAIGVNIPHLSQAYMGTWHHWKGIYGTRETMRQSIVDAVADAQQHNMAFVRFFASPGYPKGTAELYTKDKEAYWRQMDEVFDLCRKHGLRLVPSLGILKWHADCNELMTAVSDANSKTYAATRQYVREFVTRYKNDPIVLMWELENEAFLKADVNMKGRRAPPRGVYAPGTTGIRETYAQEDSLRFETLVKLYKDMTAFIKDIDPNHLVTSGDSGVREESQCRRETFPKFKWRNDTVREHGANLVESQPKPLDVFSLHMYGNSAGKRKVANLPHLDFLRMRVRAMHGAARPAFLGELGQRDPHFQADPEARWTRAAIDLLDQEGVALIALWAWHFPWQDKDYNIPNGTAQPLLMRRVAAFNRAHARLLFPQAHDSAVPEAEEALSPGGGKAVPDRR